MLVHMQQTESDHDHERKSENHQRSMEGTSKGVREKLGGRGRNSIEEGSVACVTTPEICSFFCMKGHTKKDSYHHGL